jgi:tetratricopeptide (TPR) repeat protein
MRSIICILFMFLTISLFSAETTPIQQYFKNPNTLTFQNAWNYCNEALAKDSTSISTKVMMATIANYQADLLIEAITPVAGTLDAGGKFQFANLLLGKEKYEDAIPLYQSINESTPDWSCPWRHKGTSLYMLKKYKDAEVSLQKAVETNKEHYDAYVWLAKTQYQLKKYKIALQNLETALTLNPNAEGSDDTGFNDNDVKVLHKELLKKVGKS